MRPRVSLLWSTLALACGGDPSADDGGQGPTESGSSSTVDGGATTGAATDDPSPDGTAGSGDAGTDATTGPGPDPDPDSSSGEPPMIGTPGCRAAAPLAEGEHQLMLDGYDRRYIVRLPEGYSPEQPWPLVFALHGNGGDPSYWDQTGGDRDIRTAFAQEAILIIPEAIGNDWRDYDAPPETWPERMELELAFFDAVLEIASNELCLDPSLVFSMGFSGGGSFSGVLGCRRDYIRAIAVGGSVIYFELADCTETPAAWITIGEGETNAGREAFRDFFRDHAGCQETSTPGDPDGCIEYDGCGTDTPVVFCSHPARHVWPTIGTDATREFFRRFYAP